MPNNIKMPKITVLMSVYMGEKYLREAIDSILNQTFEDFEFLIINDGSTDSSRDIILSYNDPRIRLVDNEKNMGLTRSLNKGLRLAKGEYIARMDADDVAAPERFQEQVDMLEREVSLGVVGTWYSVIDEEGSMQYEVKNDENPVVLRWKLLFHNIFAHSSVMMRKKACEDVGGYDPKFEASQDYDLWSHIAKKWEIGLVRKTLCCWRIRNEHSITIEKSETQKAAARQISVRNVGGLSDGQLSRKQCIDLYNLINGYRLLNEVSNLREILNSLKIIRKCFENMISDRSVRHEINNQATESLYRCVSRSNKFSRRLLMSMCALLLVDWESAHRVFLTFARLILSNAFCRMRLKTEVKAF